MIPEPKCYQVLGEAGRAARGEAAVKAVLRTDGTPSVI
jgi:hypothetical protein